MLRIPLAHLHTLLRSLCFLAASSASHVIGGPREIASGAFPSVVMIVTEDKNGQPLAIGSGFFVGTNLIASNAHVVEEATGGYAKVVGQKKKFDLQGIAAIDPRHDLVLLYVDGATAPSLRLAAEGNLAVGDRVYSVGNPKGLEGTFADGIVSGIREIGTDRLLQITAPISPGSSGGPILDDSGSVVGVAVATYKEAQNLNFAIPASQLVALVTKAGRAAPFSVTKSNTAAQSYLNDLGENSRRGVEVGSMLWFPNTTYLDFVFRNNLRQSVTNIRALLIFYDNEGKVCDFHQITWPADHVVDTNGRDAIPPGLAKPGSLHIPSETRARTYPRLPEVRVLEFEIVERS